MQQNAGTCDTKVNHR